MAGVPPGEGVAMPGGSDPATVGVHVVLIGYQDQGNLGMGYLGSSLQASGYSVEFVDVRDAPERIAARVLRQRPVVVGFSLIFQFFLPEFRHLASYLRAAGVTSHFTIGGHYPSLCHDEVLLHFPEIDSVCRFEGEYTLIDLVGRLSAGDDWRETPGIAYHRDGAPALSEPRALVHDLDALPFPYRPYEPEMIIGFKTLPLLASRGCARRCSFCSIHTFYRTAPGKVVRVRRPEKVVEEMLELNGERSVRVFLFQDDDFPLWGRAGKKWVEELAERMHHAGLAESTIWKISCRAEYVEPDLFARLRDAGLFLVYMGIESGTEEGLEVLHKQMTSEQNLSAVRTLKDLGIWFSYGFMLLDPSSTFESVRQNVAFLRTMVGDGCAAASFCRMLPYGGTPIRDQLAREGRLRGDIRRPDYDFLDLRLNEYYKLLNEVTGVWLRDDGISHQLNWAWEELETMRRLVPSLPAAAVDQYHVALRRLTAGSNEALFRLVEESSTAFEAGDRSWVRPDETKSYCQHTSAQLVAMRNEFVARNVDCLLDATSRTAIRGPILAPQVH